MSQWELWVELGYDRVVKEIITADVATIAEKRMSFYMGTNELVFFVRLSSIISCRKLATGGIVSTPWQGKIRPGGPDLEEGKLVMHYGGPATTHRYSKYEIGDDPIGDAARDAAKRFNVQVKAAGELGENCA